LRPDLAQRWRGRMAGRPARKRALPAREPPPARARPGGRACLLHGARRRAARGRRSCARASHGSAHSCGRGQSGPGCVRSSRAHGRPGAGERVRARRAPGTHRDQEAGRIGRLAGAQSSLQSRQRHGLCASGAGRRPGGAGHRRVGWRCARGGAGAGRMRSRGRRSGRRRGAPLCGPAPGRRDLRLAPARAAARARIRPGRGARLCPAYLRAHAGARLMAELSPQPLTHLLRRMVAEKARSGAIFDLPARPFWPGSPLDLSVRFHGARAATCAGPAAGPQSQLAQNIVLSWLCGARILELKTIQVDDRLQIPRPCIDATNVGYNIEWSQELRLEDSLYEYANAWLLVHFLKKWNPSGLRADEMDTLFDVSVGYSLDGIKSDPVARWLDALRDARPLLARLAGELAREPDLARLFEGVEPPAQIYDCVTLSTFHGCPADEIERIVELLYARHGLHVAIKLTPTLLGLEPVAHILHDQLGYRDIRVHAPSFAADLQWNDALGMVGRLEVAAARAGRTLGVKFTNTLVVENHRRFF